MVYLWHVSGIFNGGWAVLETLDEIIHSLITMSYNFPVSLSCSHPAFLTTL